jgi:ATP-dependent helicase/nuclease subunit A
MPPDRVIQAALADTPLAFLHATAHDGAQRLANLRKCGTMTRQHADQGLTLAEILAEIESAFAADRGEGESPLADETLDAVRILSVHKAKGLEFKVVFVPDLGRGAAAGRGAETGAAWLRTADGGGQLAVRLADGRRNAAAVLHAIESARHEEAEERRVLYVACTRAQEELVLVNSRSERAAPWRDRLSALGYVLGEDGTFPDGGALAGGLVEHRVITGIAELQATEAVFDPGPFVTAAETHAGAAGALAEQARPPLAWPSGTREDDRAGDEASGPRTSLARQSQGVTTRQVARLAGLAVHAALEGWDFRDRHALEARGHAAARRLVAQEAGAGAGAAGLAAAVTQEVGAILEGFLASSLPRRLAGVDIMAREAPILHRDDAGRTWTGACDLVWREPAGGIVVADYKTDLVSGDALRAAQGYGAQMAVYLGAVRAAFPGEAIRGVILFVRTGEECPLEGL